MIFQDFALYAFTAAEGCIEARAGRPHIEHAAGQSLVDAVICKLPNAYSQIMGQRCRTGVDLSGGDWQKVAIARACIRDAQLLILDELTAAFDARSEFEVF